MISGSVTDEAGKQLTNITLILTKPDGRTTVTPLTDSHGAYTFVGLPSGNDTLTEMNPPTGYPGDAIDYEEEQADRWLNVDDTINTLSDDKIVVTTTPGENEFVAIEGVIAHASSCAAACEETSSILPTLRYAEQLKYHSSDGGMAMPSIAIYKLLCRISAMNKDPFIIENENDTLAFSIAAQSHWIFHAKIQKLFGISPHSLGARYQPIDRGRHDVEELHL